MSVILTFLAPLALIAGPGTQASAPSTTEATLDDASTRFAHVLVTSYTCDLLGYGVDYLAIADLGHETRERMMADGATYDEAMERIRADVTRVRDRFNSRYYSAIYRGRFNFGAADVFPDNGQQQRFQKTFTDRCNDLVEEGPTAAFFTKPDERLSSADLSRKVRDLVALARHGD
ncbi:MAG: hypothetical protein AAF291_05135 [Pseudomonadota bacterium]